MLIGISMQIYLLGAHYFSGIVFAFKRTLLVRGSRFDSRFVCLRGRPLRSSFHESFSILCALKLIFESKTTIPIHLWFIKCQIWMQNEHQFLVCYLLSLIGAHKITVLLVKSICSYETKQWNFGFEYLGLQISTLKMVNCLFLYIHRSQCRVSGVWSFTCFRRIEFGLYVVFQLLMHLSISVCNQYGQSRVFFFFSFFLFLFLIKKATIRLCLKKKKKGLYVYT